MTDSGCEDTVPSMSLAAACKLPEESDATMRARLFTSLSQSFPHSQLYKALHGGEDLILNNGDNSEDDDDSLYGDHLSNSCFASLRMERRDSDDLDDDLCSLEWLQNEDLLKNIGGQKLDADEEEGGEQKENEDVKPDLSLLQNGLAGGQPQPHFPYHPQKHVNSKPPYSFSCLIFMAVENSPKKMLPVKDIYNWILTQFPYFQNAPTGWKNSVRHNLSLNKCFKKVEKDKGQGIGKGSLWCIDPAYRPNLLQALRKTPYHPYHQLQMTSTQPQSYIQYHHIPGGARTILPLTQRPVPNTVSPHLFPFLSRRLAQTSFDVDNEMKDVAQTLVALKAAVKKESPDNSPGEDIGLTWKHHKRSYSYNNHRRRPSSPIVVTGHPYGDHAYSSTRLLDDDDDAPSPSSSSSIDEEYEFGDAVLSVLLKHTTVTADDLLKELDMGAACHDGESDYQSDMEWDSEDGKDEVDGVLPPNKRLKIDLKTAGRGASSSSRVKKEPNDNDTDDDEQKKLHEGANALLNLAGLLLNNRPNTSASKEDNKPGSSKRKSHPVEKKKKVMKKKKKIKTVKAVSPEKVVQKKPKKVPRKSFSKRKNAGSNAKYDSDEYSLPTSKGSSSSGRSSSKSPSEKSTPKSGMSPAKKKKKTISSSGGTKVKKPITAKRKLKLSKTFGSRKPCASKDGENLKKDKKMKVANKAKPGPKKQPKTTNSNKEKTKDKLVDTKNQQETMSPKDVHKEPTAAAAPVDLEADKHNNNVLSKSCANGDVLTPAGDAPAMLPASPDLAASEDHLKRASQEVNPTNGNGDRPLASKSGDKADTPSKTTLIMGAGSTSHKSPHFTRFSKKKALS